MTHASGQTAHKPPSSVFIATSIVIFFLTLSALLSIGFVPYYVDGSAPREVLALSSIPELGEERGLLPERITSAVIGMDLPIQNPTSKDIGVLNALLLSGPVRYPDSALLGKSGNIFLFAHSSNLLIVHNEMYKAFNRISEFRRGDLITVSGGGKDYIYRVSVVRRADAEEEIIDLTPVGNPRLTLSTCDNFGTKTARWVVEADFVGSYSTSS